MSSVQDNPCLECNVNQQCCSRLSGLRLSKEEFGKHFLRHAARLSVLKYREMFLLSSLADQPCPHWESDGCKIYDDRPIDCRLYPYEITKVAEKRRGVTAIFRENDGCPQRAHLLMPIEEAKKLAETFCQRVYGSDKPVSLRFGKEERGWFRLPGFLGPAIFRISKIIRKCR